VILTVPKDKALYPTLGPRICDWAEEHLVFGPGDLRGQPYVFDDEKRGFVYRMYEIYPKTHPLAGRRRFKRVGLSLPKGLAKTELAAIIAACELHPDCPVRFDHWDKKGNPVGKGVNDPYIPMVAYTEEQSDELAYGALRVILTESGMESAFDIGLERIMRLAGDGKAVSLSSSPSGRDGARTTFAVMDETHWWVLDRLKRAHQTMLNNLAKRKMAEPWMLEITTAPEPGTGSVAESTMDYAKLVDEGRVTDASLFFFHRQASDDHDLTTKDGVRAAVIEASGPAAAWRDIDAIVGFWQDPSMDKAFLERVWLNRLVQASSQAFDVEKWKALARSANPVQPGELITLGFDGSVRNDATGLVATHVKTGYQWKVGLWEKPSNRGEDWSVPADEVNELVKDTFTRFNVWRMYADPAYWAPWISAWAGLFGKERVVEFFTHKSRKMMGALESFDTSMREGRLSHNGDADLTRHIGNARKQEIDGWYDEQGKKMWLIRKERPDSPHKIDLAMAAVLSWEARNDALASGVALEPVTVLAEWS
jgi:phage terminase large subunit-like protein